MHTSHSQQTTKMYDAHKLEKMAHYVQLKQELENEFLDQATRDWYQERLNEIELVDGELEEVLQCCTYREKFEKIIMYQSQLQSCESYGPTSHNKEIKIGFCTFNNFYY